MRNGRWSGILIGVHALIFLIAAWCPMSAEEIPDYAEIKAAVFKEWVGAYPILGPVVDVFFRTIDKELETRMGEAVDQIMDATLSDATDLEKLLNKQTSVIVEQQDIQIPQSILGKADQQI